MLKRDICSVPERDSCNTDEVVGWTDNEQDIQDSLVRSPQKPAPPLFRAPSSSLGSQPSATDPQPLEGKAEAPSSSEPNGHGLWSGLKYPENGGAPSSSLPPAGQNGKAKVPFPEEDSSEDEDEEEEASPPSSSHLGARAGRGKAQHPTSRDRQTGPPTSSLPSSNPNGTAAKASTPTSLFLRSRMPSHTQPASTPDSSSQKSTTSAVELLQARRPAEFARGSLRRSFPSFSSLHAAEAQRTPRLSSRLSYMSNGGGGSASSSSRFLSSASQPQKGVNGNGTPGHANEQDDSASESSDEDDSDAGEKESVAKAVVPDSRRAGATTRSAAGRAKPRSSLALFQKPSYGR